MKLIITESQVNKLHEQGVLDKVGGWATKKLIQNPEAARMVGIETDPLAGLSPETRAKLDKIDLEKDAPELKKYLDNLRGVLGVEDGLTSSIPIIGGKDKSVKNDSELNIKIPGGDIMMHPLGRKSVVTSRYGRRNPQKGSKNHGGIDLSAPSGSPVFAPLKGVVVRAEDTTPNGCGGHVRIRHRNGFETKFCHLKKWTVKTGDKVKKGDVIGYTGGASNDPYKGTSTGPHLHYEIVVDGISKDPTIIQTGLV